MKKFLLMFLAVTIIFAGQVGYAQDESVPGAGAAAEVDEDDADDEYTAVGKEDNLRLSGGIAFSNFGRGHTTWRGVFDYYISDYFSLSGLLDLGIFGDAQLGPTRTINYHTSALGLNLHMFNIGDVDVFAGGYSGFTVVDYKDHPSKLTPTLDMGVGLTLFGSLFNATYEFRHKRIDYAMRGEFIEIHELLHVISLGFKM